MKISKYSKIIILSAVILTISLFSIITASAKIADIDGNNSIDIGDVTQIQKVISGLIEPSDNFYELADVNEDDKIDIADVTYIQKYIAGLLNDEPVTEPTTEPTSAPHTEPTTDTKQPSTLSINKGSITLGVGEEYTLTATCDIKNYKFNFESKDTSVATVSDNGDIKAAGAGTAKIICSTANGLTADCTVTVKPMATSLSLNKSSLTLKVGNSFDFDSTVNSGAAAYYRYYYSDNPYVASIEKSGGLVTAKSLGTAKITCVLNNGVTAECKITVSESAVKCIDISTWQGENVDFKKVKASGIDYVILRAGYGKETYQKDDTFETNYKKAKEAGMKVGAYWFSYAMSPSEAIEEANTCLYCIKGKTFELPVYYDMEYAPAINSLNKKTYTNMASNFCNTIKKSGYKAGVYASASVFGYPLNYDTIAESYSVWNAEWNDNYSVSCDIWQYTDKGKVNGISGNVDLSYIYNLNIVG